VIRPPIPAPVVVRTRLRPPVPHPDEIPRPRLLTRLDDATEPVVLVAAPCGAGKTVLLAQWARTRLPPAAWVSLSSHDDSTAGVWSAVLAALRPRCADTPQPPAWQLSEPSQVLRQVIPALVNALAASGPGTLVLDGVDAVRDPATLASLDEFVTLVPDGFRVVLATARLAHGPLASLRAAGRLAEIGEDDLRLSLAETRQLLDGMTGEVLPAGRVAALNAQFDGWAAGLRLAGAALRSRAGGARLPVPLPAVEDFLRAELVDRLPPSQRSLLIRSSILDELTPARCQAVTGAEGAGEMLTALAASSLLLRRQGQGVRCHPALRAVLSALLAAEEPGTVALLHARAAERMRSEGRFEAAFDHAVLSGDPGLGAASAARAWPGIHPGRLLSGLGTLAGATGPVAAAAELARSDATAAARCLGDGTGPGAAAVQALLALLRGDLTAAASRVAAEPAGSAGAPLWPAVMASVVRGSVLLWEGKPGEAARVLARAAVQARDGGYRDMEVRALDALTAALALSGGADPPVMAAREAVRLHALDPARCAAPAIALAALAAASLGDCPGVSAQAALVAARHAAPQARRHAARLLAGPPDIAALAATGPGGGPPGAALSRLSERERAVLRALAGPLTLREIAGELHLSHNTVKSHVRAVFRKLGAHDRAEAVRLGLAAAPPASRRRALARA
jgi:LuxR family transcriptional regulator, maltose regulon positive regulatory protein